MNYFCSKDCPDLCAYSAEMVEGNYKFTGIAQEWQETGFVCSKFKVFAEREINNNIKSYHIQEGKKSEFESDESIDKLSELLKEYRNKKILYMRGSGSLAYNMSYWDVLFSSFENCYNTTGGPCDDTGGDAHEADFGDVLNPPTRNLENADTIILYGRNVAVCSQHLYAYLKTLKKQGKKIIYLDPVKMETAKIADRYIQLNPCCDGLIACALLSELGYEDRYSVNDLIEKAGISKGDFEYILNAIKSGKCAHIQGVGLQRHNNGMNSFQWINRLAVKTGCDDMLYYGHGSKRFWKSPEKTFKGSVHVDKIAESIADFDLFVCVAANPVMTFPDTNLWKKNLSKVKTIVVDTNHTETTEYADFLLKVGGMFSQEDFMASYFFEHDHSREKLLSEMSDTDAVKALGEKLDIEINVKEQSEIEKLHPKRGEYKTENLDLVFPKRKEGLQLITSSHGSYLNSQILPGMEKGLQIIRINRNDAEKLGINSGDDVIVKGEKGSFKVEAEVTDGIKSGNVMCWKNIPMKEGYTNNAIPHELTDSGNGLVYYTHFVELEKA